MKTLRGYINYGVLTKEKRYIFTSPSPHPYADYSETVEFTLPENWNVTENVLGENIIESPDGIVYMPNDIIRSYKDTPVLAWNDGKSNKTAQMTYKII